MSETDKNMKHLNTYALSGAALLAAGIFFTVSVKSQNPNAAAPAVIEQYRIVSAHIPNTNRFKTDADVERELNALAAAGWKVRAANQTAVILAR
jgi:hypothetical protein